MSQEEIEFERSMNKDREKDVTVVVSGFFLFLIYAALIHFLAIYGVYCMVTK